MLKEMKYLCFYILKQYYKYKNKNTIKVIDDLIVKDKDTKMSIEIEKGIILNRRVKND